MTRFTVILSVGLLLLVGQLQATTVMGDQPATMSPSPSCSTPTPATSTSNSTEESDYCLRRCADSKPLVCKGDSSIHLRFTLNDIPVTRQNLNVELSLPGYDSCGNWQRNITVYNVCEPVNIRCLQGERELWSYNIHICKRSDGELDSSNSTTNSTSELQSPSDKSYIAAVVLVPTFILIVLAIAVVLIWCWKQRRNHPPPAPPAPPDSDHHEDEVPVDQQPHVVVPIGKGDDDNTQTPPTDPGPVPPKDTSNSVMYRASFRVQPGSRVSREDMKIVKPVGGSVYESHTCIKLHIVDDPLDSSKNAGTLVEQCSDKHGLTPASAWLYGCKTSVTDIPLHRKMAYWIPPQSVPREKVAAV